MLFFCWITSEIRFLAQNTGRVNFFWQISEMIKKYKKWFSLCHQWPFLITWGWPGYLLPVERSGRAKNPILPLWNFFMNGRDQTFTTSYMTQTPVFGTFLGNAEWVFLRKIHFCIHRFQPKNAISRAIKEEHWMQKQISSEVFPKVYNLCCTSF